MILWDSTVLPTLHCDSAEPACLLRAVADLASDIEKLSGRAPLVSAHPAASGKAGAAASPPPDGTTGPQHWARCCASGGGDAAAPSIVIGTVQNPAIRAFAASTGIDLASLEAPDATERWRIQFLDTKENNTHATVLLCGSDAHGAMWAVYEFCERILGIDPLYLWTDSPPPPPAGAFHIPRSAIRTHEDQPHTFRYRGWFINDEDLLCGWRDGGGHRTIDYPYYHQVVHPGVMARVVETALRLKQNLLIPASFLDIDNPAEEALVRLATERGLHISQHHIEPLGVSHFAMERYWRARGRATPPSYVTEPDLVRETWRHYATRWARHPGVVWQLGLRGRGDRPVWENDSHVPPTMEARGALISRAIADQHAIVAEVLGRDDFVSTTTLWQEGTVLHNAGHLHFPPKTLILFADTLQTQRTAGGQPFYAQRWGADFHSVARQPRHAYGIYYHVAVWRSGPHLAQGVPPAKIQHAVGEAVARGDTALAITNVANLREVVLGIRAMAALTWNFASFDHDAFMRDWCARQFGNDAAPDAIRLYQDFHDAMPPLPAGDSAHPALYHDGALRESGLVCLEAMQRFATSTDAPSPSLPILDVGCSTLDVRRSGHRPPPPPPPWLENFTPQTLQNLTTWTAHGLARWPAVIANARALASRIPPERASFFHHHFIVQATIMLGLNQWLAALLQAFRALSEGPPPPPPRRRRIACRRRRARPRHRHPRRL